MNTDLARFLQISNARQITGRAALQTTELRTDTGLALGTGKKSCPHSALLTPVPAGLALQRPQTGAEETRPRPRSPEAVTKQDLRG